MPTVTADSTWVQSTRRFFGWEAEKSFDLDFLGGNYEAWDVFDVCCIGIVEDAILFQAQNLLTIDGEW